MKVGAADWKVVTVPRIGDDDHPYIAPTFAKKQHADGLGYGYLFAVVTKDRQQIMEFHRHFRLTRTEPQVPVWDGRRLQFEPTDSWIMRKVIVDPIVDLTPDMYRNALDIIGWSPASSV